ncbi:hypothetical protein GCM10027081_21700 [Cupriavidus yeoncheonensis]
MAVAVVVLGAADTVAGAAVEMLGRLDEIGERSAMIERDRNG